jgi:chromosome segregation ATPase
VTTTPREGGRTALDELRDTYREQLDRLAAERDAARRQARIAQAQADVARADLASLKARVQELLTAAARHLPDLPAAEGPDESARALPAAEEPGDAARAGADETARALPAAPDGTADDPAREERPARAA